MPEELALAFERALGFERDEKGAWSCVLTPEDLSGEDQFMEDFEKFPIKLEAVPANLHGHDITVDLYLQTDDDELGWARWRDALAKIK